MVVPLGFSAVVVCLSIVRASGFASTSAPSAARIESRIRPRSEHVESTSLAHLAMTTGLSGASPGADTPELTALDFYSGIGGLRVSLEKAVEATTFETTVESYEISTVANSVRERSTPHHAQPRMMRYHVRSL